MGKYSISELPKGIERVIDETISEYGYSKTIEMLEKHDESLAQYVYGLYLLMYSYCY